MLQKEAVLSLVQYSIQNLLCVKATSAKGLPLPRQTLRSLTLTRKFLNAVGIPRLRTALAYRKEVVDVTIPKLYITVMDGQVSEIWYDDEYGIDRLLNEGTGYVVEYVQKRTERCKVCDRTYPESEIVKRDGEQLCQQCDLDKYPIRDEDIPY